MRITMSHNSTKQNKWCPAQTEFKTSVFKLSTTNFYVTKRQRIFLFKNICQTSKQLLL